MSQVELRRQWEQRVADYRESGQTQAKWCAENHVKLHQLHYWLKKFKSESSSSTTSPIWVSVTMDDPFNGDSLYIKIGQASIEVRPGFDPSFLADVIRTLRSL